MNPFDSFLRFKFASAMAVLAASLPAGLAPELAKATAQQPPSPPPNPPPSQTRPGGGLNPDSSAICAPQNDSLQALVPVETPVLTASAHPIFFFYVPFSNEVVERAEFSMLLWPGELERHYKADILLPDSPGIVGVTLPDGPDYALDAGQNYRWYLNIYCQDGGGQQPDLTVNGVVQRVTLTAAGDRQGQGAAPEIWHDALASAVEQLERSPEDPNAVQQLLVLLQQIDAGDISEVSLAGRATPLSE